MKKKIIIIFSLIATTFILTACNNSKTQDSSSKDPKTTSSTKAKSLTKEYIKSLTDLDLEVDKLGEPAFNIKETGVQPKEAVGFFGEGDVKMTLYILKSADDTDKVEEYFLDRDYKVYADNMDKYVFAAKDEITDTWFNKYQEAIATT